MKQWCWKNSHNQPGAVRVRWSTAGFAGRFRWPILALGFFMGLSPGFSIVYYVDDRSGDDRNDGLSTTSAWRTLERVNSAALKPGDEVRFRRGGVWRGQLRPASGVAGAPIVYGAWGEGPKPRLLGSVPASKLTDWTPAGPSLWRTAVPEYEPVGLSRSLPNGRWRFHCEGSARWTSLASSGGWWRVESSGSAPTHVQWFTTGLSVEPGRFYQLRFRARSDPTASNVSVRLGRSHAPWTSYAPAVSLVITSAVHPAEYVAIFRPDRADSDARITFALGSAVPSGGCLEIDDCEWTEIRLESGVALDVDVGNIIFNGGAACGVKRWSRDDLRRDGEFFYDATGRCVWLYCERHPAERYQSIELALKRHIIDQSGVSWVVYEDLALGQGAAHGIGGARTQGITVRRCDVAWIGGALHKYREDGQPVRYGNGIEFWSDARDHLVEDCRLWEIYDAALTTQGDGTNRQENIVFRNNVVWKAEYSFEFWNRGPASLTRNIRFEHNTCVDAGFSWGHAQRPDPNGRHLMFFNNPSQTEGIVIRSNIFVRATDSLVRLHGRDWTRALSMDGNVWWQPEGVAAVWGTQSVSVANFPEFLAQRGWAAGSLFVQPKFIAPERGDYRVAADSPVAAYGARAMDLNAEPIGSVVAVRGFRPFEFRVSGNGGRPTLNYRILWPEGEEGWGQPLRRIREQVWKSWAHGVPQPEPVPTSASEVQAAMRRVADQVVGTWPRSTASAESSSAGEEERIIQGVAVVGECLSVAVRRLRQEWNGPRRVEFDFMTFDQATGRRLELDEVVDPAQRSNVVAAIADQLGVEGSGLDWSQLRGVFVAPDHVRIYSDQVRIPIDRWREWLRVGWRAWFETPSR